MNKQRRYFVYLLVSIFILVSLFSACGKDEGQTSPAAGSADNSPVVAKIGKDTVTVKQLDRIIESLPPMYRERLKTEEGRKYILDDLVTASLLSQEAERLKLDEKPEVRQALDNARKRILMGELLRTELAKEVLPGEKEAKAYYELNKEQFAESQGVRLRQIVLANEQEAERTAKDLKAGADFKELARQRSVDPSKANGGLIGWVKREQMSPEIAQVISALSKGQTSKPIRMANRYHIMLVEDRKSGKSLDYDQVKPAIVQRLRAQQEQKIVDGLRTRLYKELNVTIHEENLRIGSAPETKGAGKS
ncbi:MAG: peptidyl-prolyl cis-trans isomerase [Pseudomonadota bacterium]